MNPLKGPSGFGRIVNGVMNIIMCAILSIYVLWTCLLYTSRCV